jgi:inner membrane protein
MTDSTGTPKTTDKNATGAKPTFFNRLFSHASSSSLLARCGLIVVIALALHIPLGMVRSLILEREFLHQTATGEIATSWGEYQTISGPVLVVPYEVWEDRKEAVTERSRIRVKGMPPQEVEETKYITSRHYIPRHKIILPAQLAFAAELDTEIRYRGIHQMVVYTAPVSIQGSFTLPDASAFEPKLHKIHWEKAWLAVGATDPRAIVETTPISWENAASNAYRPGTGVERILGAGFHAPVPFSGNSAKTQPFSLHMKIRGSGGIAFTPVGEHTSISVHSSWPDPSFQGNLLPVERHISPEGFRATWTISNLTRNYSQIGDLEGNDFINHEGSIKAFKAGVDLRETVSLYRMAMRATQYAILFVAATFTVLFAFDMAMGRRMRLLQYGMVGLIFYLQEINFTQIIDER